MRRQKGLVGPLPLISFAQDFDCLMRHKKTRSAQAASKPMLGKTRIRSIFRTQP